MSPGPFPPKGARRPAAAAVHAVTASPGALDGQRAWRREKPATNMPPMITTWRGRGIGRRVTSALLVRPDATLSDYLPHCKSVRGVTGCTDGPSVAVVQRNRHEEP